MSYNSLCIDQTCDLNCCDYTGHCPSSFQQCRHFLPQTQTTSSPAVSVTYNCSVYVNTDVYTQCINMNAKAQSQGLTPYNRQLVIGFGVSVPCAIIIGVIVYCWCKKRNAAVNDFAMPQTNNQQDPIPQNQQYNNQQNHLQTNLTDQINQNPAINYGVSQNIQEIAYRNPLLQFPQNPVKNQGQNPVIQSQHYPEASIFQEQKPSQYSQKVSYDVQNSIKDQLIIDQEDRLQSEKPFMREKIKESLKSQTQLMTRQESITSDDSDVSCNTQELENFVNYFFPFLNSEFFEDEFESLEGDTIEFAQKGRMRQTQKNSSFTAFYPPHMIPSSRKNEDRQRLRLQKKENDKRLGRKK